MLEARQLVAHQHSSGQENSSLPVEALNALGYEEAAHHVYGMTVGDWKKTHQKKATEEQMERYNASKPIQAVHDKDLLKKKKLDLPSKLKNEVTNQATAPLSNVCCQDVEDIAAIRADVSPKPPDDLRNLAQSFQPPPLPTMKKKLSVAVLTVSDRAFKNEYATGDLSGPAVLTAVDKIVQGQFSRITAIVPDEMQQIASQLQQWCDNSDGGNKIDLILTTGGTGMSKRDVTPEATRNVLDLECAGLMNFVTTECSHLQPLSSLSRGTAGIRGGTLIANLPGNPKGVAEVLPLLLPLLLHALEDIEAEA